jgi:glycosyltransferase involved in cell wall biosynthesis
MGKATDMRWRRSGTRRKVGLTVAICFLNEREEVRRTVESIRETAGSNVDVLLINDASKPDYDYAAVARNHGCRYIENTKRLGPAAARSLSIDRAETPAVLLLDAHMRFYDDDWWRVIEDAVSSNPRALYSVRCPTLHPNGELTGAPDGLGAWVHLETDDKEDDETQRAWSLLSPAWNIRRRSTGPIETVPCVLGGAYAFDRAFFQEIGGHLGQREYGGEEPYISVKAWMAGGSCQTLADVTIGHIYRTSDGPPFSIHARSSAYNKMVLLAIVFPTERFEMYRELMRAVPGYREGVELFQENWALLRNLRRHLHERVFQRQFGFFESLNNEFRSGADISDRVSATG